MNNVEKPKILIVDDERFNITTLHDLLRHDYQIMVATGGEQGLNAAINKLPDLILLDITMPDMNGLEVCRQLKLNEATLSIPVIFITALDNDTDETLGLELGAADYITKPFNLAVVKARVRTQLRLKSQSDLLEKLAFRDGLTSLSNRRAFDERLGQEWNRCHRSGLPLSLIMLDVDHFKLYNDHYGHGAGDECLTAVAYALTSVVRRPSDMVARYGGEEFVILLPETGFDNAKVVASNVCSAVAGMRRPHLQSKSSDVVTISAGLSTTIPRNTQSATTLLEQADAMLYKAKSEGRNRAVGSELEK